MKEELQSLKVGTGWNVTWHTFYDFEPTEEYINYFSGSSLFLACNLNAGLLVCLEWRPEFDINGEFIFYVIEVEQRENEEPDYKWESPIYTKYTKDKSLVVKMLDTLMVNGLKKLEQIVVSDKAR